MWQATSRCCFRNDPAGLELVGEQPVLSLRTDESTCTSVRDKGERPVRYQESVAVAGGAFARGHHKILYFIAELIRPLDFQFNGATHASSLRHWFRVLPAGHGIALYKSPSLPMESELPPWTQ